MSSTETHNINKTRQLIRHGWEQVAAVYAEDRLGIFNRCAEQLLNLIRPQPGASLLDIGTGPGVIALQATKRVGFEGRVVGSDIAAAMVHLAKQASGELRSTNLSFCQMDAEQLGFADASFETVTCAFSLFQFPNMRQALAEMVRVVKQGGQVGLSNWGVGYFSPVADMQRALFYEFGLQPLLTNPITFKPDELQMLLESVGLTEFKMVPDEIDVWFKDPQAVWDYNMSMGPFPVMLHHQLSTSRKEILHKRFIEMVSAIASDQGVRCTFHLLYSLARRT